METDNEKVVELLCRLNYSASLNKLINIAQQKSPEITKTEIKQLQEKHITTQLTKEQRKEKPQGHTVAYYLNELWQLDIFDLARYQYFNKYHIFYCSVLMYLVVKRMLSQ